MENKPKVHICPVPQKVDTILVSLVGLGIGIRDATEAVLLVFMRPLEGEDQETPRGVSMSMQDGEAFCKMFKELSADWAAKKNQAN